MSIQIPKFTYINGISVDNRAAGEMTINDVKIGQSPVISPAVNASGSTLGHLNVRQVIEKVDFSQGSVPKVNINVNDAYNDVVLAPASGMTVTGVLTYGSGKITNTTVYPTDNEKQNQESGKARGQIEFSRPNGPQTYDVSKFST